MVAAVGAFALSCAQRAVPDPRDAARRWAAGIRSGDADVVFELMSEEARQLHGRQGVARLVRENQSELSQQAEWISRADARVDVEAKLTYAGDRSARMVFEDDQFRVAATEALPAAARTPTDALRELRAVLRRRSYDGLLRVLTRESRNSVEGSLGALEEALLEPSTISLQVEGRRATARLPGGHTVQLEREDGVWKVKDFD